jgi:hypothetical protein
VTPADAVERAIGHLLTVLPDRVSGWQVEPVNNGCGALVSEGQHGELRLEVDGAARIVRLTFVALEVGVLRVVRLAIGPVEAGQGWPERLADGAAAFVRGEPDTTIRHRRAPPHGALDEIRVRWVCPACSSGTWTPLGLVLHRTGAVACASCSRPAEVELSTTAQPVRLRLVPAGAQT